MLKRIFGWLVAMIGIGFLVFYFSKKAFFKEHSNSYYGFYNDVRGVEVTSPIFLRGVKVGSVKNIQLDFEKKIRVDINLEDSIRLLKGTRIVIANGNVNGSKSIRLEQGSGYAYLPIGSELQTGIDSAFSDNFYSKVTPFFVTGEIILGTIDSTLYNFNQMLHRGLSEKSQSQIRNLEKSLSKTNSKLEKADLNVKRFRNSLNLLEERTSQLNQSNLSINNQLSKVGQKTKNLSTTPIGNQFDSIRKAFSKLSDVSKKIMQSRMVANSSDYLNLNQKLDSLHRSLKNYQNNPPPIIQLFGDKGKGK
ncbi:MAG: MCE family protein [Bacteroidetes bacterium]|nr:MCE family protein [Bacteroidota bacterium]